MCESLLCCHIIVMKRPIIFCAIQRGLCKFTLSVFSHYTRFNTGVFCIHQWIFNRYTGIVLLYITWGLLLCIFLFLFNWVSGLIFASGHRSDWNVFCSWCEICAHTMYGMLSVRMKSEAKNMKTLVAIGATATFSKPIFFICVIEFSHIIVESNV